MEEKLWQIFENVNHWLDHAERKNALLLTFIGIQLTVGKVFISTPGDLLIAASVVLGICFLITLVSFFPHTAFPGWECIWKGMKSCPREDDNLLFYGDISKYSVDTYSRRMGEYLNIETESDRYLKDLCAQIVINSKITARKNIMFRVATYFMISGQVLILISFWSK